jgi:hypothetical protein
MADFVILCHFKYLGLLDDTLPSSQGHQAGCVDSRFFLFLGNKQRQILTSFYRLRWPPVGPCRIGRCIHRRQQGLVGQAAVALTG